MNLPPDISSEDVEQWLNNCWFRVNGTLVRYVGRDDSFYARQPDGEVLRFRPKDVDIVWPHTGAVNVQGFGALYVQRTAQRQWRRAYTARGLVCRVPGVWDLKRANPLTRSLIMLDPDSPPLVAALFDPWYPAPHEVGDLLTQVPSVALNRQIIVTRTKVDRVYYNEEPVGVIENGQLLADCSPRIERRVHKLIGGILW